MLDFHKGPFYFSHMILCSILRIELTYWNTKENFLGSGKWWINVYLIITFGYQLLLIFNTDWKRLEKCPFIFLITFLLGQKFPFPVENKAKTKIYLKKGYYWLLIRLNPTVITSIPIVYKISYICSYWYFHPANFSV